MSTGFENPEFLESSFGSFNSEDVDAALGGSATEDVDKLLSALEATTHEDSFLKSHDDDLVKELLWSEKQEVPDQKFAAVPSHFNDNSFNSLGANSLGGSLSGLELPEPLGLDETPSDPNLLANLAHDMAFQQNSTKLDEFVVNSLTSKYESNNYEMNFQQEQSVPKEPALTESHPEPSSYEPVSQKSGKRRRAPRRGSLPSMHLHYEDPFEPTPLAQPIMQPPQQHYMQQQQQSTEPPTKMTAVQAPVMSMTTESAPPTFRPFARRGSLPTMHLNYSATNLGEVPVPHGTDDEDEDDGDVDPAVAAEAARFAAAATAQYRIDEDEEFEPPRKMGTGRMQRRGSTGSFYCSEPPPFTLKPPADGSLRVGDVSAPVPENLDPHVTMKRLEDLMKQSLGSQRALQKWDKDNGLPKSHSQTMVNTSRSRKQLQEGVILPKWDGTPLISEETELGKPKARSKPPKKEGGRMQRRMSAPVSSNFVIGA